MYKTRFVLVAAAFLITILLSSISTPAAVDMFIKIEGIDGESEDSAHKGEIDVLSWSWGVSMQVDKASGRSSGSKIESLTLNKHVDASSPGLMLACASGKHIPDATLVVRKAGARPLEYIKIEMKDVMVSSVSTGGDGSQDRPTEEVTFNFGEIKMTYTSQRADGSAGASSEFAWDVRAGRAASQPAAVRGIRRQ